MGDDLTADAARDLAREAYLFGLPLVYIDTPDRRVDPRRQARGLACTDQPVRPLPRVSRRLEQDRRRLQRRHPVLAGAARRVVRADRVERSAMGDRFWIVQVIDGWNNVPHAPGSRTVGGKGGNFALIGPGWHGELPDGVTELRDADRDRDPGRPHLHRRSRRLRRGPRPPGPAQAGAAVRVGHRLRPARRGSLEARRGGQAGPAQVTAHLGRDVLQPAERAAGRQPARTRRSAS